MTVQDLIEELKRLDPHLPVVDSDENEIDCIRQANVPGNKRTLVKLWSLNPAPIVRVHHSTESP